ncbi:MAG: hypothetical protein HY866_15100, partial [Chloroflexi bacterium]|nr:hypothetical protein [Chloroflexota bacterium]
MAAADRTILDKILSSHTAACQLLAVKITPDELVHVVGSQEPVRDQPDERARTLLTAGWLKIEAVQLDLPDSERASLVTAIQQSARTWLKQSGDTITSEDREQVRWLTEKTRSRESKQQIAQRVWLAAVVYGMNHRAVAFDSEGQVLWEKGIAGRIGLSPDAALDLAWMHGGHEVYTASFRQPDGTIIRGKGRQRWHVYRLSLDPAADVLFERRAKKVQEKVALIVASEIHA